MLTKDKEKDDGFLRKSPSWRKIILFNGPPQCGKSFGAQCMHSFICRNASYLYPRIYDFAEPLKRAAHALYCSFHSWDYYDTKEGAPQKGLASGDFLGLSPREAYIAMSEEYLKKMHGEEVLGFLMKKRMTREPNSQVFLIPNNGFVDELKPLVDFVGQENILLVEVHAADRTFEGDSRSYVGEQVKERWSNINVNKLPNIIGNEEDRAFYRMLCEGTAKKFLDIEEKDE